ncbi:MAG: LamG-like jellyroll fold domain-containing protein [Ignavibacteria bacterium]|nr:LamG-like jellyroll fold domain-containing protein [Ignavibacteria bacterium]
MKKIFTLLVLLSIISATLAQVPTRKGWWKFDDTANITKADLGTNLELVGTQQAISGPAAGNGATRIGVGSHFKMTHGITASPTTLVNEYSIQFDFRVKDIGTWRAFFQTSPDNSTDGDCFLRDSGFLGVAATGYGSYEIKANEWYRLVVSVKNGVAYKYYLDGQLYHNGTVQTVDGRFSLDKVLLIFADEDGEDNEIDCAELAIWDKALTGGQAKLLGGYNHELPKAALQPAALWNFDNSTNLTESVYGYDLELVGTQTSVDGPTAVNKAVRIGVGSHLKSNHGIAANGGGTLVNEYTMKFDFKVADITKWRTFFQTAAANTSDGECFINKEGKIGTQATGYGAYALIPNEWYRLVISVKNGTQYKYFLDGQLLLNGTMQAVDSRFALESTILLFGDNDGDDAEIDCAEAAIWDRALTDDEVKSLAGYGHSLTGGGTTTKSLVGNWKFDNPFSLLTPTVGNPLVLVGADQSVDGPTATNFATRVGVGSHYKLTHGIAPNGGGLLVNEYTLRFDFRAPSLENWHCFFQTSPTNANDGELFINKSGNIGLQATGYTQYSINQNEWYRMVVSVQNGTQFLIYLDGTLVLNGTIQAVDSRFGLDKDLLIFADEDGEDTDIDCAELSIYNYALSEAEIKALGGFGHTVGVEKEDGSLPTEFSISQNYPNPFNPLTKIDFALPAAGNVSIKIYDILGNEVSVLENGYRSAGYHSVNFDGSKLASGVYIYRMISGKFTSTKKLVLLK